MTLRNRSMMLSAFIASSEYDLFRFKLREVFFLDTLVHVRIIVSKNLESGCCTSTYFPFPAAPVSNLWVFAKRHNRR